MSFDNDFVKFDYHTDTLYVNIYIKKAQPIQGEWDLFIEFFKNFYLACDQLNQKIILYYDLMNLGILEKKQYDEWLELFKNFEEISVKCLICSAILTTYEPLAMVINGLLIFHNTSKPVKVFSNREESITFITKNKEIHIIDLDK